VWEKAGVMDMDVTGVTGVHGDTVVEVVTFGSSGVLGINVEVQLEKEEEEVVVTVGLGKDEGVEDEDEPEDEGLFVLERENVPLDSWLRIEYKASLPSRRLCHHFPDPGSSNPVAISNNVIPTLKISAAGEKESSRSSGAM